MKINHNPGWKEKAQKERRVAAEARQAKYEALPLPRKNKERGGQAFAKAFG